MKRIVAVVTFCAVLSACGGGGASVVIDVSSVTPNSGESSGSVGVVTVSSTTEHYEMIATVGETVPVGLIESENGNYEIQNSVSF